MAKSFVFNTQISPAFDEFSRSIFGSGWELDHVDVHPSGDKYEAVLILENPEGIKYKIISKKKFVRLLDNEHTAATIELYTLGIKFLQKSRRDRTATQRQKLLNNDSGNGLLELTDGS